MNKVTCISFHGTGSGAIDDYLKEFNHVKGSLSNYEARLLYDPDGISDLYYNLCENPNRLNSEYAIKRYLLFAKIYKKTYSRIFGKKWILYTKEYINKIIKFQYLGYWGADLRFIHGFPKWIYYGKKVINKFLPKKIKKKVHYNYFPRRMMYQPNYDLETFISNTKEYIDKLCDSIADSSTNLILLDQFVPTSNIERYLKFVNDLKVIIVDRDPRDIFIKHTIDKDHVLPKNIEEFIINYRESRRITNYGISTKNILFLKFEDLVYKYDDTMLRVNDFLSLNETDHINKYQYFNPSISKNNTRLWEKYTNFDYEIKRIEEELYDFLYKYEE